MEPPPVPPPVVVGNAAPDRPEADREPHRTPPLVHTGSAVPDNSEMPEDGETGAGAREPDDALTPARARTPGDPEATGQASPEEWTPGAEERAPGSGEREPGGEGRAAADDDADGERTPGGKPAAEEKRAPRDHGEWHGIVLVTGTDTEVGKTIATAAMAVVAQQAGLRVAVIKPGQTGIATGAPTDAEVVTRLAGPETVRTLAEYPEPLAPLAAAKVAGMPALDLFDVVDAIRAEAEKHDLVLVEGAGGLLVPMGLRPSGEPWTFADLATTLGANMIVVARAGLGTLNHTALTLEALNRRAVPARVILGAWPAEPELVHWANLGELVPHLVGALPAGAGSMDPGVFRRSAPGWLTPALHGVLDNWRVWAEEAG